jgi:multiple sugar transport system substrate-binding protein
MSPIKFSICGSETEGLRMQAFLEPYNASRPPETRVEVTSIPWDEDKETYTQMALYNRGDGIAEVGAPVVNDLLAMDALRPFSGAELVSLGGKAAFSKIAWENTNRVADGQVWAIPWLVDPRGLVYWRDLLAEAGVDEQTAFQSAEHLEASLQRLQQAGYPAPMSLPGNTFVAGQASCSWAWGAGGEFLSPDGRHPYVTQPAFLEGLHSYFRLAPYLAPNGRDTGPEFFLNRQCVVAYGSMWAVTELISKADHPLRAQLGLALPPGPAYAGGSSLVIWKNTRNVPEALQLIRYLTCREAQISYPVQIDHLPARQDVLDQPPFSTDPILTGFVHLSNEARPFPPIKLGGLLQTLYCHSIGRLWARVASEPELDLKAAIQDEMTLLSRRFEKWLD